MTTIIQTAHGSVEIRRGTMSRTGLVYGHLDEGRCVQVTARRGDTVLSIERLHGGDRFDATVKNRIGGLGAFSSQWPDEDAVREAFERASTRTASGESVPGIRVLCARPKEQST